ncbi:MAG: alpha/beta hydrolase [Pseudomonadota bacterium]
MLKSWLVAGVSAPLLSLMALADQDQTQIPFAPVETPVDAGAIALFEGAAPGSEASDIEEIWRDFGTERWATNVTTPTLLPVLPEDPSATRAAVLVIPGGGFQFVSMDNEGYPIADWLAEQGVAAFVLKYRTMETPNTTEAFAEHMRILWAPRPGDPQIDVTQGIPLAVADAQSALTLMRAKSEEWGFDSDKVGVLGFSAGAITALAMTGSDADGAPKPDFMGYIYGPMTSVDVPRDAPPMFAALAADDALFAGQGFGLVDAWRTAGIPVELHYYQSGGHGFGSYKRGVPADDWFDQFTRWMAAQNLLTPPVQDE